MWIDFLIFVYVALHENIIYVVEQGSGQDIPDDEALRSNVS